MFKSLSVTLFTGKGQHFQENGGGVMLLVRSSILTLHWYDLETDCELLWVEVRSGAASLLFYRPPT